MKKFKTVLEFGNTFNTEEKCFSFLCELKWSEGFCCRRCEHTIAIKGRTWYYRKCQKCKYDESCTAHTLFHKLKFPITSAFMIVHQISTLKKGLSTCEIGRQHHVHQETAWFFKRKVQQAMDNGSVSNLSIKIAHLVNDGASSKGIEEYQGHSVLVTLAYQNSDNDKSKTFIVAVMSDKPLEEDQKLSKMIWADGQYSLSKERYINFELKFQFSPGQCSAGMKWYIYHLKHWMRGIHHLVSLAHLQRYLNEFQYRFDRRAVTKLNPFDVLNKMIKSPWLPYSKAKWN